jgi:hypothetical protein
MNEGFVRSALVRKLTELNRVRVGHCVYRYFNELHSAIVDFGAINGNIVRSGDTDPNSIALDRNDFDANVVGDNDLFADPTG